MGEAGYLARSSTFDSSRPRASLETCPIQGFREPCRNLSTGAYGKDIAGLSWSMYAWGHTGPHVFDVAASWPSSFSHNPEDASEPDLPAGRRRTAALVGDVILVGTMTHGV